MMKTKRFLSVVLILCLIFSTIQVTAITEANNSITVNASIVKDGQFVAGEDLTKIAHIPITVYDCDQNSNYDINEVLYALHEQYYDGGAEIGYSSSQTEYGLSLTKLWGDDSGNYSYYINNNSAWSLTDTVTSGDYICAFVYQDSANWSDKYTFFKNNTETVKKGEGLSLELKCAGYDDSYNPITFPVENATITINGEDTVNKTDADGRATISFNNMGIYTISAKTEYYITPPICYVTVTTEDNSEIPPSTEDKEETETPDTPTDTEKKDYNTVIYDVLEKISATYVNSSSEWIVMDMGAYEKYEPQTQNKLADEAKQKYINSAIKTIKETSSDTAIDKAVLGLVAISKNPELLYLVNSNTAISAIEKLNSVTKSTSAWSAPYTLAVYNQGDYNTDSYETEIINTLLANQKENGSWDEYGTIDTTANVIAGLSFYKDRQEVGIAIEKAINYLSTQQNDNGTFSDNYSGANANSTAMVAIGICAAGVDLVNDTRFIKNEKNIIDGLLSFLVAEGNGFGHTNNQSINLGATEQAFRALISIMQTIKTGTAYNVYDFSKNVFAPARETGNTSSSAPSNPSESTGNNITVKVTIKSDTEYWLNNYSVTISGDNATVYHAFVKACSENSITHKGALSGYIKSMTSGNKTLNEFDKGENSGWLYKVNGELPTVGFTEYNISNGDRIVWYYTEDWTKDPSSVHYSSGYSRPAKKEDSKSYNIDEIINDTANYVYETVKNPSISSIGGEWVIFGLARSNVNIPTEYFNRYYENVKNELLENGGILHDKKYTEYSRVVLCLTSIGQNPLDVGGYNILKPIYDYEKTVWQGVNGAIFALVALDCGGYGKDSDLRDLYVKHILDSQNKDGGFAMSGDVSEVDTTAMALSALSDYKDNENVKSAIEKALLFISKAQLDDGSFKNQGTENCESLAQVIVALCELGIDIKDSRFVKNKKLF